MKFSKFCVIILNLCLVVLSVTLISSASSPRFIYGDFYNVLISGNNIGGLNLIWVAGGFVLLAMGIFGLWSALKESAFMMNLYTTILSLTLILQIITALTSNKLNGELDYIVSHSIKNLIAQYRYNPELATIMDSIQKEYSCCGHNGPSDWDLLTDVHPTKRAFTAVTEPVPGDEILEQFLLNTEDDYSIIEQNISDDSIFRKNSLPTSCCKKKCKNYNGRGCFKVVYKDIARVVFMVKTVAMISSVLQIFGILAAYIFGKTLSV